MEEQLRDPGTAWGGAAAPTQSRLEGLDYRFEGPARPRQPTLLLLHGTGGDEHDLIELGRSLLPGAALLSPRGAVVEDGMARFFRRLAPGVFDLEDLARRTDQLAGFIAAARDTHGIDSAVVAVGLSNGANIAASLMLRHPRILAGAILFRAMVPFRPAAPPALEGRPVLVAAGRRDPLVAPEESERLADLLSACGAAVETSWAEAGHALTQSDLTAARSWLSEQGFGAIRSSPAGGTR
ncbi:MAG TPA: alpha/beta hydrolase [Candidatus Nitrosotalea sp.]|nr:alpha/beta hydrolase [Candidatus Nitrosotalea sp.]